MTTTNAMFTITDTGDLSGRNLLQRAFFTKDPWTGPTYNAVGEGFGMYHDKYCLPVTTRYLYVNTNKGVDTIFPDLTFEEGVQYTISGKWAQFRTDDKFNKMYLRIHHTDGTMVSINQPNQNNAWSPFTLTSTAGKTVDKIVTTFSSEGTTYIENFKLEIGAAATDWTPAPEDVNDAYVDAKTAKNEIDGLEVGGRNLILKGDEEHTRTVTTEGGNGIIPLYSFSLYGQPLAHDEGRTMSISFEYESSGNSLDTGRIYVQHNGTELASTQNVSIYLNTTPSGRYIRTYTITSAQAASESNYVRVYIVSCSAGTVVKVKNMKVELGNRATDWTPAPEDTDAAIADVDEKATGAVTAINNYIAGKEIVVGTQTAATNVWTGRAGFFELANGQEIAYWLPYAGLSSTAVTLTLTLADNSETAAIPVYYKGTTRATTHFTAGTVVHLTYRENADVAGTTVEKGWWADASYDSGNTNYYDRIRLNNTIKAKSAISASHFIVSDDGGYFHLAGGSVFDITKPILWCSTAISAGGTGSNNYISLPSLTLRNNASGITLTANKTCYLVGTLAGKMFTVKSSGFFTSTVPTSDDGYYYISLGYLYSTYQIYLYPEHPIYKFVDGSFKSLNQVAYEASVVADEAKSTAESKNSVYYQTSAPTGKKVGDTWFDTNDGNKIYRWNGSTWVAAELGDSAVANLSASKLIAGSVMGNVILGGTIQAGGSDVGQDGKVLVKDVNNTEVASLSKEGLVATAGSVGGWDISTEGLVRTEVVSENVTRTSKFGCWNDSMINGGCTLRLLQKDPQDENHVYSDARITYGVGNSNGYIDVYDEEYDTYEAINKSWDTNISAGQIDITVRDSSSAHTVYDIYGPNVAGVGNIAHWSVLSPERAVKDAFKVTVYHCGNLFWAHFTGRMTVGLGGAIKAYIPIVSNDDENLTKSKYCAPPFYINKYMLSQEPANPRAIITVRPDGTLGLGHFIKPTTGANSSTVTIDTNWEECDIFWAHIG